MNIPTTIRRICSLSQLIGVAVLTACAVGCASSNPSHSAPVNLQTHERLVSAKSQDGLVQTGLLVEPNRRSQDTLVLWIHGASENFYHPSYVGIARASAERGYPFLTGNTRMHDIGCILSYGEQNTQRGGAYWGLPQDQSRDIRAWIDLAEGLGYSKVVLVGHSAGGPAARGYLAEQDDPRVVGLVLASVGVSPGPRSQEPARLAAANALIAAGKSQDFLPDLRLSAATYLDYSKVPAEIWDFYGARGTPNPAIGRIRCPLLVWFGAKEPEIGTAADLERIRTLAAGQPTGPSRIDTLILDGADHLYTGREPQVAEALCEWIRAATATQPKHPPNYAILD